MKRYHDSHSHGHDNEDSFDDSIIMKDHEANETLHLRKSRLTVIYLLMMITRNVLYSIF